MSALDPAPHTSLLTTLDRVLRGDYLQRDQLLSGRVDVPTGRFLRLALLLGGIYGACLGTFAVFRGAPDAGLQLLAAGAKVPLLFLLTLIVTFPSLYVFAALQRLPLDFGNTLRLLLLTIVVHLAVIASLGPVFAFFAASTDSYAFLKLLNVAFFAIGGVLGFMILRAATRNMFVGDGDGEAASGDARNANERAGRVLRVWCLVYGIVGAQMGWLLRPFLGSPDLPFTLLRPREDNIFIGIVRSIAELFGG